MIFKETSITEYTDTKLQQICADGSISMMKLTNRVSEYNWSKDKELIDITTLDAYFTKVKISYYRVGMKRHEIYALLVNHLPIVYFVEPGSYAGGLINAYLDGYFTTFKNSKLLKPIINILEAKSIRKYISDKNKNPIESAELLQKYYQVNEPDLMQYRKRNVKSQIFMKATLGDIYSNFSYWYYHNISIRGYKVKIGTLIGNVYRRDTFTIHYIGPSYSDEMDYHILRNAINVAISLCQNIISFKLWSIEKNYVKIDFSFDKHEGIIVHIAESNINLSFKHKNLKMLLKPTLVRIMCNFALEFIKILKTNADYEYVLFFRIAVHS